MVIGDIKTRTCMGCQRKALIELPAKREPAAHLAHPLPVAPAPEGEGNEEAPMEVEPQVELPVGKDKDDGFVISAMMKAATCCLHCGGRWMRVHV